MKGIGVLKIIWMYPPKSEAVAAAAVAAICPSAEVKMTTGTPLGYWGFDLQMDILVQS